MERAPFAHLVSDPVFDSARYATLAEGFPPMERFCRGMEKVASNQAVRIPASAIVDNPEFSDAWRDFFRYHTSRHFWADIVRVFGKEILAAHPDLERKAGRKLAEWSVRSRGSKEPADVELDALFVINTPVERESSVRPAHVDNEDKIFAGLFYMRAEDDATPGGDLALYSFKGKPGFGGHYAPLSSVNQERVIEYRSNRFVAFVNSPESVHGVIPRPKTDRVRRYINFVAVTPFKTFSIPKMSPVNQLMFWLERRKTKSAGVMAEG
ncbi:MAG: hypothetical protein AB7S41_15410 [Parvibaculaceae bacterium]